MSAHSRNFRRPRQIDRSGWPLERKLELNWIIGELNWFRADRHPQICQVVCEHYFHLNLRTNVSALEAKAHEWLFNLVLSDSPGRNQEAQQWLYRLLEDTVPLFNRAIFDSDAAYPLDAARSWAFSYWSYIRQNNRLNNPTDKKLSDPDQYAADYLAIDGADCTYFDRVRRAHLRPTTTAEEIPRNDPIPRNLS